MNILRKSMIIGLATLAVGSASLSAHAEDTTRDRTYAATKFDPAKRAERIEKRQQALHDALKLNPHQEAAWKTYIAAVAPKHPIGRADRVALKELPAPQRMEKALEWSKARVQQQEIRLAALKTFYGQLTPEQQKTFDQQTAQRGHRHHGMQRRG